MNENIRKFIVEKSLEMFILHGVKSTRMDDIAATLKISKRTLYELFGDRKSLILACVEHNFALQEERREELTHASDVIEELMGLIDNWEEVMGVNIALMDEIKRYYPTVYEQTTKARFDEGIKQLKLFLNKGIEQGIFIENMNVDFASHMLGASIHYLFFNPTSYGNNNFSLSEALKYLMMGFFRGISTQKGIQMVDKIMDKHYTHLNRE